MSESSRPFVPTRGHVSRRVLDVVVSSAVLLLCAAPLVILAVAIRLTSPGPVLYRQTRVGRNARTFTLLKFRTMRKATESALVTADGDDRITKLGGWLRRAKLDELPQFFNVLRGDMTVVGPRPEVERFVATYTAEERVILKVKPGLASMAQLVYPNESEFLARFAPEERESAYVRHLIPRKVRVDLEYERRRSILTDLRLMVEAGLLVAGIWPRVDHGLWEASDDAASRLGDAATNSANKA